MKQKREAVANSQDRRDAIANAIGEPISSDAWFKISPYGVFKGRTPGREQHFNAENAALMVSEFNSVRGKLGRLFRGAPVYRGHPDVDPKQYPDDRRRGKIVELEARGDGLWGKAEWNSLGQENVDQGYWLYPSPYWDAPGGQKQFTPDRLISVGLTNTPRIVTSEPIANSDDDNQLMDRQQLIAALGLPDEATDEEILAAIKALQDNADTPEGKAKLEEVENSLKTAESERESAENAKDTAETALKDVRKAYANSLIDAAVSDSRIAEADREEQENAFAADFDAAEKALKAMKPTLNTKELSLKKSREELSNAQARREKVENAVSEKMQANPGMSYLDAHSAVKRDPEMKEVFEAMAE